MVFRIDRRGQRTLLFSGLLDREALEALTARCADARIERLILSRRTDTDPYCLIRLFELGVELEAEAPYLGVLLRRLQPQAGAGGGEEAKEQGAAPPCGHGAGSEER